MPGMFDLLRPAGQAAGGFFKGLKAQNEGIPLQDRLLMAAMAMGGRGGEALQLRQGFQQQNKEAAARQRRNAALKGAYGPDGRFNRQAYMDALGDDGDALEALQIEKMINSMRPEPRIFQTKQGIYRLNEQTGEPEPVVNDEGEDVSAAFGPHGGGPEIEALVEFPEERRPAPAGFQWSADGSTLELIPGYAEGIDQVSRTRRKAIVDQPMPRVGGGGGGRGGGKPKSYGANDVNW